MLADEISVYDLRSFVEIVREMATEDTVVFYNTECVTAVLGDEKDRVIELELESTESFQWLRQLAYYPQVMTLPAVMHYAMHDLARCGDDQSLGRVLASMFAPGAIVPEAISVKCGVWTLKGSPDRTVDCQMLVDFISQRVLIRPLAESFAAAEDSAVDWLGGVLRAELCGISVFNGSV